MSENDLDERIEAYTQEHGVMPTRIFGTYKAIAKIGSYAGSANINGDEVYVTPLGSLSLHLDIRVDGLEVGA